MPENLLLAQSIVEHIHKMLHAPEPPSFPPEFDAVQGLSEAHAYLAELRRLLNDFAKGDLTSDIRLRGILAGRLKALQANLLHLTWQIQQVADGDFTQRVDFMGEFSTAFNSMVEQLDGALASLRRKEEELTRLTLALQDEVAQKGRALSALRESEASFRYMAEHDALTGTLNRRSFFEAAGVEMLRAKTLNYNCSIAILDIDHFKRFNDTYGHIEGDGALRHVTRTISSGLRQGDLMARYGGEEFVLLLPVADRDTAQRVIERLRKKIADTPVETQEAGPVSVTVSIGLASIPPKIGGKRDAAFLEEALKHADEALYVAKRTGRNKLIVSAYPEKTL